MNAFVIAEMGSCHDGSLHKARQLVEVAKECGADAVKAQYWSSAGRLARRRNAQVYQEVYEKYRVPEDWLPELKAHADDVGIEFMCTSYLPEDVWRVAEYCQRLKIASFEASDRELLTAHVAPMRAGKKLYVSCGMGASRTMVQDWLVRGLEPGRPIPIRFLLCVSAYPAPVEELRLARIRAHSWLDDSPPFTGFSDHSPPDHTWTGALAVAAGASTIERHFRREHGDPSNPDYPHAMNPRAFHEYVRHIRFAETVMGYTENFTPHGYVPSEQPMRAFRAWSDRE